MKRHEAERRSCCDGIAQIRVPTSWTAEQAILVLDFLEHLIDVIWSMHEGAIAGAIHAHNERADRHDDEAVQVEGERA